MFRWLIYTVVTAAVTALSIAKASWFNGVLFGVVLTVVTIAVATEVATRRYRRSSDRNRERSML